ncbi:hypothetical protein I540_0138 [Mycobacteroides abscessus subsp. bolletii 1513]|uniref:CobW/HypB/UreG nucleotide-binding domain-containing protein n=1 Tax=Mycobacteroides abscessus subsp. bolletii 1513 TaxID=1299321 RepID=X8E087_9MYCO|nr:hypothetical protein I540_0138 [Mycobacteroides abscessus subsp. bolletii 1513]
MRTPVLLVSGQTDTDAVTRVLARDPGTVVVTHRFDGHIVMRSVAGMRGVTETVLELAHGCVSCTIRDDLLVLLRKLHRRDDVGRIVLHLEPWLEADPICWAINTVPVRVGPDSSMVRPRVTSRLPEWSAAWTARTGWNRRSATTNLRMAGRWRRW